MARRNLSRYSVLVRCVRTLRHFEAHVELQRAQGELIATIGTGVDPARAVVRVNARAHGFGVPRDTSERGTGYAHNVDE